MTVCEGVNHVIVNMDKVDTYFPVGVREEGSLWSEDFD